MLHYSSGFAGTVLDQVRYVSDLLRELLPEPTGHFCALLHSLTNMFTLESSLMGRESLLDQPPIPKQLYSGLNFGA